MTPPRHARTEALHALEELLQGVRKHHVLNERKRGTFYRRSTAFLHFHEDPSGLFADLKLGDAFQRFEVTTVPQRRQLLDLIDATLRQSLTPADPPPDSGGTSSSENAPRTAVSPSPRKPVLSGVEGERGSGVRSACLY